MRYPTGEDTGGLWYPHSKPTRDGYPIVQHMVAGSKPLVERFGSLNLPLGGTNGYVGVRKCKKGGFQGYTPQKSKGHFTGRYDTAQEAAVARAIKQQEIALGFNCDSGEKLRRQRAKAAAAP